MCIAHTPVVRALGDLLDAPEVASIVSPITWGARDRMVAQVSCVERLSMIENVPACSAVVLTEGASAEVSSYRFDIALRVAGARNVAALFLTGDEFLAPPSTARAIADRAGVALVRVAPGADLAALVVALHRELVGGAAAALARAEAALSALLDAEAAGAGPAELLAAASKALGVELRLRRADTPDLSPAGPVAAEAELRADIRASLVEPLVVAAPRPFGSDETAVELVLHLAAAAVDRALTRAQRAAEVPVLSTAHLLGELLVAEPHRVDALLNRARSLGVPIDGWHVVVAIEVEELPAFAREDEVAAFELTETIARLATEAARSYGGVWHRASSGPALLLIRMDREDPGPTASAAAAVAANKVVRRLLARIPGLTLFSGVGSAHSGLTGLRASAAEARAAVAAARTSGRENVAVSFDAVGIRRMLLEWYASETARRAVESILAPLETLGPKRRAVAIRTLQAYLDNQGSLSRTAAALHLHRNAVAYRLKRIMEVLDVDLDDPDARLVLQLACRARALS